MSKRNSRRSAAYLVPAIAAAALMIASSIGMASAGGDTKCGCGCLECGECPTGGALDVDGAVATNATNSTILWWLTTSSAMSTGDANISWGNSTAYVYSQPPNQLGGENPTATFLDYLEPNTTYYYKVTVWSSCEDSPTQKYVYHGSTTGSWSTSADHMDSFVGTIHNQSGGNAPSGVYVYSQCSVAPPAGYGYQDSFNVTVSGGRYSVGEPEYSQSGLYPRACTGGTFEVAVDNQPVHYYLYPNCLEIEGGCTSAVWSDSWNETVVLWAAQVLDFYLPETSLNLGPWIPVVLDFTDDSATTFDYSSGLESTTTSTWSYDGSGGSASVTSSNLTDLNTDNNPGSNLEYYAQYDLTGAITFNAVTNRLSSITSWSYTGGPLATSNNPNQVTDPVTPFFNTALTNENCYSVVPGGATITRMTTYEQSLNLTSSFDFSLSVGLDLGNGLSVSAQVLDVANALSNGGGHSWSLSYSLYEPSNGTTQYVWVYVQPGTTNQVGPVAHAWSGPACP
jgi:hypothetical protein